jgi:hypothetical protein
MSEDQVIANKAEAEFQAKINKLVDEGDFSTEAGMKAASKSLNSFLSSINKMNVNRDLVAYVYSGADGSPKVEIFCRHERLDQLKLKLGQLRLEAEKNKDAIAETLKYIEAINRIGLFQ